MKVHLKHNEKGTTIISLSLNKKVEFLKFPKKKMSIVVIISMVIESELFFKQ